MKHAISSAGAPKAIGPYSQAVRVGDLLFLSGQVPLDPATGTMVDGDITAQTRRVMDNLVIVLEGAGYRLAAVVSARIYLTDFAGDYAAMNETYQSYFPPGRLPARTCIGVTGLARGALVEIDLVARK